MISVNKTWQILENSIAGFTWPSGLWRQWTYDSSLYVKNENNADQNYEYTEYTYYLLNCRIYWPLICWSEGNICSRRFTRVMRWPPLPYSYSAAWFAAPLLSLTSIPSGNWVWYGLFNANSPIHAYNVNDSWEGTYSMRFAADRNFVKCLTKVCSDVAYPDFCVGNTRDILQHGEDSFRRKVFECSPQWRTVSALLNRTAGTPAWPPCHIFHRPLDDDNSPPQPLP